MMSPTMRSRNKYQDIGIIIIFAVAGIICALLPGGCQSDKLPPKYENMAIPDEVLRSKDALIAGKSLFAIHCASCHGAGGKGDGLRQSLLKSIPDFTNPAWMEKNSPRHIYYAIIEGKKHSVMAGWKNYLKPTDAWNITAFILSLPP